jgi:hypothetical protein
MPTRCRRSRSRRTTSLRMRTSSKTHERDRRHSERTNKQCCNAPRELV